MTPEDIVVLELSSFQLMGMEISPDISVITNVTPNHLNIHKDYQEYIDAKKNIFKFQNENGILILNADDANCLDLANHTQITPITYSIQNKTADFQAVNITFDNDGFPEFDVYYKDHFFDRIKLSVPGTHNILNSLACIALCTAYGIEKKDIKSALLKFTCAHRRFEFKGKINGNVSVYDDYGHHPTEIVAIAKSLSHKNYRQSWAIFQPHTYSRTKNLLADFAKALLNFDHVIVLDIYAAREKNTYGITSKDLVNHLNSIGKQADYIPDFDECVRFVKSHVQENDIVMTLGAGTVTQIGPMLVD